MNLKNIKENLQAFTLIEMVITIVIIIVLTSISVPIYRKHTLEAKRAEAYLLLSTLKDAEMRYYAEYRCFLDVRNITSNEEVLGVDARVNKYFTCFYIYGSNSYSNKTDFRTQIYSSIGNLTMNYNLTSGATFK